MSETNSPKEIAKVGKGRNMLLLLAVVFILPFTIAATLHLLDIRPSGKSFGHLITPPINLTIPDFKNVTKDEVFPAERWSKIWSIVMIDHANCTELCQKNVDTLNRVHRTLPKEVDRIQRILLLRGDIDLNKINQLQTQFPNLIILSENDEKQQRFVEHFTNAAPEDSVYLVDPLNNLMMDYPKDIQPKALRSDLVRLLKNSWGG